jgi:N-sulfoglucosamine sulfohydrolase
MREPSMNRREFIKTVGVSATSLPFLGVLSCKTETLQRPNVLWLVSEDNGPFLGCYGDSLADTPNLDRLASDGIVFENAFANAPVCAPARSTIITGMYACSLGTHHMRSYNPLPEHIKFFTNYLRETGYYCSNNAKEDYNVAEKPEGCWDESSREATYKKRRPGQPFFAVFNFAVTHESSLHQTVDAKHDPARMRLPAYHPDTPEIRHDWAQYYDKITELDKQIGEKLAELEADGLAEKTIVFYYADHAGVLPRSKRFLYDSGTHVPLLVRFPKKYQNLAPAGPGSRLDRLVSFVDLAPSVLNLAGIDVPEYMQGIPFLGKKTARPKEYVYLFRDRMDERYDMMRAVRDKRYKYIRNFMPHLIYGQFLEYLWRMPATRSWENMYKEGKCLGPQKLFWETKPPEELFDIQSDPDEVKSLVDDPARRETLDRMRKALDTWILEVGDLGFLPEAEMLERSKGAPPFETARDPRKYDQERILGAANLAIQKKPEHLPRLIEMLDDEDSAVRYWAAVGCRVLGRDALPAIEKLRSRLKDTASSVRIVAAEILAKYNDPEESLLVLKDMLYHPEEKVRLQAINAVDYLEERALPIRGAVKGKIEDNSDNVKKVTKKTLTDLAWIIHK